jgi:hypothetical protein
MKSNQIRAEVFNLEGNKVHICRDLNQMDLSRLPEDVYVIIYRDGDGNTLWTEKYVTSVKQEFALIA